MILPVRQNRRANACPGRSSSVYRRMQFRLHENLHGKKIFTSLLEELASDSVWDERILAPG